MSYPWLPGVCWCNERPEILIPDTQTLKDLAQAKALHLLHRRGYRVVVPDIVAIAATDSLDEPYSQTLTAWFDAGDAPGSQTPVLIEPTWIGRAFVAARRGIPDFQWPIAGELVISQWLNDHMRARTDDTVVVHTDSRVPQLMCIWSWNSDTEVFTVCDFLKSTEKQGIVTSAEGFIGLITGAELGVALPVAEV